MDWLIALICPLMTLPMLFFMMKGNKSEKPSDEQHAKMKVEIEMLKDQNNHMREILDQVEQKRDLPS
ncbi:MAG: hypothetical protein ACQEXX_24520 [Bacillota bacterium]